MPRSISCILCLVFAVTPFFFVAAQQAPEKPLPQMSEQVYKDIVVFKGVPASDLIPAMEFMSASLGYQCSDCHDPNDYAAPHRNKDTARKMVLMQRKINAENFNNRLEVTCNSCHGGKDHPAGTPLPAGIALRHERTDASVKPEDLFAMHLKAVGAGEESVTRKGTLTAPNITTHKVETSPLEVSFAPGGKFRMAAADRLVTSDGVKVWYGETLLTDEPAAVFARLGRAWRGEQAFAGLERLTVSGKATVGKAQAIVVRGVRPTTSSTEELYFDAKSGLLLRLVNIRRSTIGTVVSSFDYSDYRALGGSKWPMKVVANFADGTQWVLQFKSASMVSK